MKDSIPCWSAALARPRHPAVWKDFRTIEKDMEDERQKAVRTPRPKRGGEVQPPRYGNHIAKKP